MWIQNLERERLQRSMKAFTKLLKSKSKAIEPFAEYVLDLYYNGIDKYGNKIEESSREESFERRWNKARAYPFGKQISLLTLTFFSCYKY